MDTRIIDGIPYHEFTEEELLSFFIKQEKATDIFYPGGGKEEQPILFDRAIFSFDVCLFEINVASLEFRYCIFEQDMIIANSNIDNLMLIGSQFQGDVFFQNCEIVDSAEVRNGKFHKQLKIEVGSYQNFSISQDASDISIISGKFNNFHVHSNLLVNDQMIFVDKLFLGLSKIEGTLLLEEFSCKQIYLKGNIESKTEINLKSLYCNNFEVANLFNNGKLRIFDLNSFEYDNRQSLILLRNSNFGKAEFFDCDFSRTGNVIIKNCFFVETLFVKVIWQDQLQLEQRQDDPLNLLDLKETYRQLKYSYSKQGDAVLEHKFHALEMDTYRQYLRQKRISNNSLNKYNQWRQDRQTSIILWFSSWSSQYGQSFKAPIYTLLGAGIILFPVMVTCGFFNAFSQGIHFDFTKARISATIGHFLNFINPLRRYDTQEINIGLILDFIMRIIASYCIYNFIRATRRFVK